MIDTPFAADFRALLEKHKIAHPRFAYGLEQFDPAKPKLYYSGPVFDAEEIVAATAALVEGKWSVAGEYVHRFEREFSKVLGVKESVMVNSGSSADLLMVAAAKQRHGWKDREGVIVSPVGFPTTISAITLNELTPHFVDIEWDTLNFDLDRVEKLLAESARQKSEFWFQVGFPIRAILVSPVLGNPPDIDRLIALRDKYGIELLLDGCDSLGTTWGGKPLAQYFAASTCSFFPSHHISTLQGGMISSDDVELIKLARQMATWGRDCHCRGAGNLLPNGTCGHRFDCWLPLACPDTIIDHRYLYSQAQAYNLQPLDLQGAIGLAQLDKLKRIHDKRWWWKTLRIDGLFNRLPGVETVHATEHAIVSWFGAPVICPNYDYKRALVDHLEKAGIQTRNYFAGNILLHPAYADLGRAADFPHANEVLRRVFFVGCPPTMTEAHFAYLEATVKSFSPPAEAKAA